MNSNKAFIILLLTAGIVCLTVLFITSKNKTEDSETGNKVWVYIELQTKLKRDTSDYYLYGQVKESVIHKIDQNSDAKGLFILYDMRYWTPNDLIQFYKDEEDAGYKIFRIQDIVVISPLQEDPIFLYDEEDLHPDVIDHINNL